MHADEQSNYDFLSDEHNLIIGSIVLLLTLAGLVIAVLTLRQGRPPRPSDPDSTNNTNSVNVELGTIGSFSSQPTIVRDEILLLSGIQHQNQVGSSPNRSSQYQSQRTDCSANGPQEPAHRSSDETIDQIYR
jgi:hypothetical protein